MARLNIDTPPIAGSPLSADLNRWFTNVTDQVNSMLGNVIADRTVDIGGGGAGPISVAVRGLAASSIVTANIHSSTNPVTIQKVTATGSGFDILFSSDPGASCFVNYNAFITPWAAQGA